MRSVIDSFLSSKWLSLLAGGSGEMGPLFGFLQGGRPKHGWKQYLS